MDNLLTGLTYSIFDPTGNITALVESDVDISRQPSVAAALMHRHPEVEQVGFVCLHGKDSRAADAKETVQAELRMAGGEFCGNASMSTAALYLLRREKPGEIQTRNFQEENSQAEKDAAGKEADPESVFLRVSGAAGPVEVRLRRESGDSFTAGIRMPHAKGISRETFSFEGLQGALPVVRMEGISHIIIEEDSAFFSLQENRAAAGRAVRAWCRALEAEGLGLMFLAKEEEGRESEAVKPGTARFSMRCTPLVYIPVSGTEFWENSCASGSSAAGMYLASEAGEAVSVLLREPGGSLFAESDPQRKETWLHGRTRLVCREQGTERQR